MYKIEFVVYYCCDEVGPMCYIWRTEFICPCCGETATFSGELYEELEYDGHYIECMDKFWGDGKGCGKKFKRLDSGEWEEYV